MPGARTHTPSVYYEASDEQENDELGVRQSVVVWPPLRAAAALRAGARLPTPVFSLPPPTTPSTTNPHGDCSLDSLTEF